MNYLIHIGPHKTGSTYLQFGFHQHRDLLLKHGIYYSPQFYVSPHYPNHLPLFRALIYGDATAFNQLRDECDRHNCHTILISSEDLSYLDHNALAHLRLLLRDSSVSFIYYVRRWSELLPSLWQEGVKHGASSSLPEFVVEQTGAGSSGAIRFDVVLQRFADIFGIQSLRLISYNNLMDDGLDILDDFLSRFLGVTRPECAAPDRMNVSSDPVDIEINRALNAIEWRTRGRRNSTLRELLFARKEDLIDPEVALLMRSFMRRIAIDDQSSYFRSLGEAIIARFGGAFVNDRSGLMFSPGNREAEYIGRDCMLDEKLASYIRNLYGQLAALSASAS